MSNRGIWRAVSLSKVWSSRFRVIWLYHSEIVEFWNEWMLVVALKNGHGFHAPYYSSVPVPPFPPLPFPSPPCPSIWLMQVLTLVGAGLCFAASDSCSSWLLQLLILVAPNSCSSRLLQLLTHAAPDSCRSFLLQLLTLTAHNFCNSWLLWLLTLAGCDVCWYYILPTQIFAASESFRLWFL
jgi:hypothetical protein